jgi:hypothetical protein
MSACPRHKSSFLKPDFQGRKHLLRSKIAPILERLFLLNPSTSLGPTPGHQQLTPLIHCGELCYAPGALHCAFPFTLHCSPFTRPAWSGPNSQFTVDREARSVALTSPDRLLSLPCSSAILPTSLPGRSCLWRAHSRNGNCPGRAARPVRQGERLYFVG